MSKRSQAYAGYTLESSQQGRLFLELEEADATQLAQAYGVRAGGASSVEVAHLSAIVSSLGTLRITPPEREKGFTRQLPLYVLRALGLKRDSVQRLSWLGVERVGQLQAWKQRATGGVSRQGSQAFTPLPLRTATNEAEPLHPAAAPFSLTQLRRC